MAIEDDVAILLQEVQAREPFVTSTQAGYDGNPNDPGAPSILVNAPLGGWYHREGTDTFYRKRYDGVWQDGSTGSGDPITFAPQTTEDFSIPVDYNDPTAVDPPAESFGNQQDVNDFLTTNSAVAVKHLDAAYNAIAPLVFHTVDIAMAVGVHRPQPGGGISLSGKVCMGGTIEINGAAPSLYEVVDAGGTITAHQVSDEIDGGDRNPWVQVSGATWTPSAFKGQYAVMSTGQTAVIRDNTADKLFLLPELVPAPTNAVDTVFIGRPSTIIRNSLDDTSREGSFHWFNISIYGFSVYLARLSDLRIDDFGATYSSLQLVSDSQGFMTATRVYIDKELQRQQFSIAPDGRWFQVTGILDGAMYFDCVALGDYDYGAGENGFACFGNTYLYHCFVRRTGDNGLACWGFQTKPIITLVNTVIDDCGSVGRAAVHFKSRTRWSFEGYIGFWEGRANTIEAHNGSVAAVIIEENCETYRSDVQSMKWANCAGHLVEIQSDVSMDHIASAGTERGWRDGGGNTGIGVRVVGAGNTLRFGALDDIAGAGGEIELEGVLGTWADLPDSSSPLVTQIMNIVSHE